MQHNLLEKQQHIDSLHPEYAKWGAGGEEGEIVMVVVTTATAAAIIAMEIVTAIAAAAAELEVRIANAHLKYPS